MSEVLNKIKPLEDMCRLCGYSDDDSDFVEIFDNEQNYVQKIKKYLYLLVSPDEMSEKICWMCVQRLDNFHKFHEKIHEKQQKMLKEKYDLFCIKLNFIDAHEYSEFETIEIKQSDSIDQECNDDIEMYEDEENLIYVVDEKQEESEEPLALNEDLSNTKKKQKIEIVPFDEQSDDEEYADTDVFEEENKEDYYVFSDAEDVDEAIETETLFPTKIMEKGLLLIKGKKLMALICKFYDFDCEICEEKNFRSLKAFMDHYTNDHNQEGYVSCCENKLSRYTDIVMHMARHIQPSEFKCDTCEHLVSRPWLLKPHKLTHLPDNEKPFKCTDCPRKFCSTGALKTHQSRHSPTKQIQVNACNKCGKVYETIKSLVQHKKIAHTTEKMTENQVCHICAKLFATRSGLIEHLSTIHKPRENAQVQCKECNKWLMNARCLKSHMILHSKVEYNCKDCDYSAKKLSLLKRHEATKHSSIKPYSCSICEKSFKMKRALTIHIQNHTQQPKSYQCEFCDRIFASSTNFYAHRKKIHPKELAAMKKEKALIEKEKRIQAGVQYKDYLEVDFT